MPAIAPATASYDRWKAPAEDGRTLIWPAPAELLRETADNQRGFSSATSVTLQGVPLSDVRSRLRQSLGYTDLDRPLIATGHQAELHHSGVWVKNALINVVADRLAGRAIHFAVDTDEPKHLLLRWPGGSVPLTDSERPQGAWSGLVQAPSPSHLREVEEKFDRAAATWKFKPLVPQFLASIHRLAHGNSARAHSDPVGSAPRTVIPEAHQIVRDELENNPGKSAAGALTGGIATPESAGGGTGGTSVRDPGPARTARAQAELPKLPSALTTAVHELDASLGLRHDSLLVSPICSSEPYLLFVHHVLARADVFAADYNAALDEFRHENKIRTPGRPMPNLKCLPEGCEAPFWLDDLSTGARTRAAVAREENAFSLRLPNGERFHLDPSAEGWSAAQKLKLFLHTHNARLSPRALTLTAVLRLLVADQFVHGIGGGQYDQVLDKLIARHFHFAPPRFSVTTATLYFPGAVGQSRVCLPCVAQEGHRLKHSILGQEKSQLVEAIAAAPRESAERAALFSTLHNRLSSARSGAVFRDWEQRFSDARQREQEEKVLFDRELFYAIQPADRLGGMIETYRRAFV